MKSKLKYQTQTITIAGGVAAGIQTFNLKLDTNYKYCKGIFVNQGAGSDAFLLGFQDQSANYSDPAPLALFASNVNTPVADRIVKMDMPANGNNLSVSVTNAVVTAGANRS